MSANFSDSKYLLPALNLNKVKCLLWGTLSDVALSTVKGGGQSKCPNVLLLNMQGAASYVPL